MEQKTFNGDKGLASHKFNFYAPCGGYDLATTDEIVDFLKDNNYAVCCREYPGFRAFLHKYDFGYLLVMLDHDNYRGETGINFGMRLTSKRREDIVATMSEYCSNHTA